MNYKLVRERNKWAVVEKRNGLVIEFYKNRDSAIKLARRLNLGKGFDGWTPTFFARERITS